MLASDSLVERLECLVFCLSRLASVPFQVIRTFLVVLQAVALFHHHLDPCLSIFYFFHPKLSEIIVFIVVVVISALIVHFAK